MKRILVIIYILSLAFTGFGQKSSLSPPGISNTSVGSGTNSAIEPPGFAIIDLGVIGDNQGFPIAVSNKMHVLFGSFYGDITPKIWHPSGFYHLNPANTVDTVYTIRATCMNEDGAVGGWVNYEREWPEALIEKPVFAAIWPPNSRRPSEFGGPLEPQHWEDIYLSYGGSYVSTISNSYFAGIETKSVYLSDLGWQNNDPEYFFALYYDRGASGSVQNPKFNRRLDDFNVEVHGDERWGDYEIPVGTQRFPVCINNRGDFAALATNGDYHTEYPNHLIYSIDDDWALECYINDTKYSFDIGHYHGDFCINYGAYANDLPLICINNPENNLITLLTESQVISLPPDSGYALGLSNPANPDEDALSILTDEFLLEQKRDPETGELSPISSSSFHSFDLEQIVERASERLSGTEEPKWALFQPDAISGNGSFIVGLATNMETFDLHAVMLVRIDMDVYLAENDLYPKRKIPNYFIEKGTSYIRLNGDDDNENGISDLNEVDYADENDLVELQISAPGLVDGNFDLYLKRENSCLNIWVDKEKSTPLINTTNTLNECAISGSSQSIWIENVLAGECVLYFGLKVMGEFRELTRFEFKTYNSLIVILGGEDQHPSFPIYQNHGIFMLSYFDLYKRFGYDVIPLDEDNVDNTGGGYAYHQIVKAIKDQNISSLSIIGYSHGGGSTYDLVNRLNNNRSNIGLFTIDYTAYIDAIDNTTDTTTGCLVTSPPSSLFHDNFYGTQSIFVRGCYVSDADDNCSIGRSHTEIDNDSFVLSTILTNILKFVEK